MRGIAVLLAAAVLFAGCGGDDEPNDAAVSEDGGSAPSEPDLPVLEDPYETIETALLDGGFDVCGQQSGTGDISGSYDSVTFEISRGGCAAIPEYLNVDRYNEASTATAQFASDDPENRYVVWQFDPTTVGSITQSTPPAVIDRLIEAFDGYPVTGMGAT